MSAKDDRYNASPKGKARRKRYATSEKRRASQRRYATSEKGHATKKRWREKGDNRFRETVNETRRVRRKRVREREEMLRGEAV